VTTPTSLVTGVDFISVASRNLDAAVDFYAGALGLPCSARYSKAPGAEFETGSLTLQVIESEAMGLEFRANNHPIALQVEDVEAARAELESRGVSFAHDTIDSGICHMAVFKDPDGNTLMLHRRYAPRTPRG